MQLELGRDAFVSGRARPSRPGPGELLVEVAACGVCRTDLHIVDGELERPAADRARGTRSSAGSLALGEGATGFAPGERVGVPWLGRTCGHLRLLPARARRICATRRSSPASPATAASPAMSSPTRAYCFADPGRLRRRRGRAFALRRADRLPSAEEGGRGGAARPLRLRRRRPHPRPARRLAGAAGLRLHPPRRRSGARPSRARSAAPGRGARATRRRKRSTPAILFAPVGALVPEALRRGAQGRPRRLRRNPHERHPVLSLCRPVGRAQR